GRSRRSCGAARSRRWSARSSGAPSKVSDEGGGLVGRDLVPGEPLEDVLAAQAGGLLVGLGLDCRDVAVTRSEAERPDERLDPGADRRVGDPELPLHVAEVPARAEETVEEGQLLTAEAAEPADAE